MQTKGPEKDESTGRLNRFLRTASFWALLVLIPIAIIPIASPLLILNQCDTI